MTEDHPHEKTGCPLCDGDEEYIAALKERLEPVLARGRAQRGIDVVVPTGLTRAERHEFLRTNPIGTLVLDQLTDAEIDDWIEDHDRPGDHAWVCATNLSERNMMLVFFGREDDQPD
ncbi:hypothetical protein [Novosphingobium sp.]|jgi:hypothetical protein|uniref:hypothetical protein n=1 Tax=Novosphingobium sp. TaxID=1874826 RepID=UPI002FDFADF7